MAKYKVTVTRVDEYEIEIDEKVWDAKALKDWSKSFTSVHSTKHLAENFAIAWMRNEHEYFIEGYGYVKEYRADGDLKQIPYTKNGKMEFPLPEEKYTKGISITPISQDENYETEVD